MSEKTIVQEAFLNITRVEKKLPNGVDVSRIVVRHKGAAVIIPVTENGNFLMIKQYRLPVDKYLIEFPAGGKEDREEWIETAQRELREETGFAAKSIEEIGTIFPTPGFCDEIQFLFVAKDLYESSLESDFDEDFEIVELSGEDIEEKILKNEITDAKTIASYMKYKLISKL